MFIRKDMHPARKTLRGVLLALLGVSIAFLGMVVTLRVIYRDQGIEGRLQAKIFEFDVLQHQTRAYFSDDRQDMDIVEQLLHLGMFSPLYTQAGMDMLNEKADTGYQPAVERLSNMDVAHGRPRK